MLLNFFFLISKWILKFSVYSCFTWRNLFFVRYLYIKDFGNTHLCIRWITLRNSRRGVLGLSAVIILLVVRRRDYGNEHLLIIMSSGLGLPIISIVAHELIHGHDIIRSWSMKQKNLQNYLTKKSQNSNFW